MKLLMLLIFNVALVSHQLEVIDLTITVTNIKTFKGNIEIWLFNKRKSLPIKGKYYKAYSKRVTNNTMIITLIDNQKGIMQFQFITIWTRIRNVIEISLEYLLSHMGFQKIIEQEFQNHLLMTVE